MRTITTPRALDKELLATASGEQLATRIDRERSETLDGAMLASQIMELARGASIEIGTHEIRQLEVCRPLLPDEKKIYVSHLPKQTWSDTETACITVRAAGFDPVPHVPVRLIPDASTLDRILANFIERARVREVLLIAGDAPEPLGPYMQVRDVLESGLLAKHDLRYISMAGHPEGHPRVPLDEIRRAEHDKSVLAEQLGIEATLVTQFFFEAAPFLEWARELRAKGVRCRLIAGLAGPAGVTSLLKLAARCGVGPSTRALKARPSSLMKLANEHGPEEVLHGLAQSLVMGDRDFDGIHLYSFGGFRRTCEWLHAAAAGNFTLDSRGGFRM